MNPRLVNLLGSFITGSSEYALARLEFAMKFPRIPAPPTITRLPDASERTLRERWQAIEVELADAVAFVKHIDSGPDRLERADEAFGWLKRKVRELDQYARALRWVLTVTEHDRREEPS